MINDTTIKLNLIEQIELRSLLGNRLRNLQTMLLSDDESQALSAIYKKLTGHDYPHAAQRQAELQAFRRKHPELARLLLRRDMTETLETVAHHIAHAEG